MQLYYRALLIAAGLVFYPPLQSAADGVPAEPAMSVEQLWENPHLRERGFFQSYTGQDGIERELPATPWRFDGESVGRMTAQPIRGEHNVYVFEELLGLSKPEVETLVEEQVIY